MCLNYSVCSLQTYHPSGYMTWSLWLSVYCVIPPLGEKNSASHRNFEILYGWSWERKTLVRDSVQPTKPLLLYMPSRFVLEFRNRNRAGCWSSSKLLLFLPCAYIYISIYIPQIIQISTYNAHIHVCTYKNRYTYIQEGGLTIFSL